MSRPVAEWVNVTDDISIVARESGEVWFHNRSGSKRRPDPFAAPMEGAGAPGSTIGLLDGAINLGVFNGIEKPARAPGADARRPISSPWSAPITPPSIRREISGAPPSASQQLGRPEVAAYLELRAREETGHDRLALKDLRALGVPGERLVANYIPEGIKPLCKRFDELCAEDYPIGSIGYSYCLERIAALKEKSDIEKRAGALPRRRRRDAFPQESQQPRKRSLARRGDDRVRRLSACRRPYQSRSGDISVGIDYGQGI